jgi:hypothetical protein
MLHRCPSISPVLLHELTFCTFCVRLNNTLGSPVCFQGHRRLPVGNRFPPKRSANASASSGCADTERATVGARGRQIETGAAPIRYVAELIGADTDSERGYPMADRPDGAML